MSYCFDDTLIYARYIKNLFEGHGLVYNTGEYFNGLTSPFFTYLSIAISFLFGDILFSINLLSAIFMALTIYIFYQVFLRHSAYITALVGGLFIATSPYFYSVFGMETLLFTFLIGLSIFFFLSEKYNYLLLALTVLLLTRNEGIFLVVALVFEHFRLRRNFPPLRYFILPIVIVTIHFSFNYFYYGAFLPETGSAKVWQGASGLWGTQWPIFITGSSYLVSWYIGPMYLALTLFGLALIGIARFGLKSLNIIIILFSLFYLLFYVVLNIPNYHWYNAPLFLFFFYYAAAGIEYIYIHITKLFPKKIVALASVVILSVYPVYNNIQKLSLGSVFEPYKNIGLWLKDNTAPKASVAAVEIGLIGWYSERQIIDILGLVNPLNAKFIGEKKFNEWLNHYTPDYIVVHNPLWPHEQAVTDANLNGEYLEHAYFPFNNYKLYVHKNISIDIQELKPLFVSNQVSLNLNNPINQGSFSLDETKQYKNFFKIVGWAFNSTLKNPNTYILLQDTQRKNRYFFSTKMSERKDVATAFNNPNLINSGFVAHIPNKLLAKNTIYEIKVVIDNNKTYSILNTNRYLKTYSQ